MMLLQQLRHRAAQSVAWLDFERHTYVPWLLAAGLPLLVLRRLWTARGIIYSRHSDLIAQFLSLKIAARRAIGEDGTLPLWDPAMNAGTPALANPQSGYFNPLEWVYFVLPLDLAANLHVLLSVVTAALTMFLLARQLMSQIGTALVCSAAYAMALRLLATIYTGWLPNLVVYSLVPLLPWALLRLYSNPSGRRAVGLALVIGLLLVQGDAQQVYYAAIGSTIYCGLLWFSAPRALRAKLAGLTVAAFGLGLLLALPAILPRLEYAALSTRQWADYRFFLRVPPRLVELRRLFDPEIGREPRTEFWENNFYFGLWLMPLWVAALFGNPRRAFPLVLSVLPAIALCFDSPLLRLAYQFVPGFWMFRQSPRILFGVQLLVVLIAGFGLDALIASAHGSRLRKITAVAGLATALLAVSMSSSARQDAQPAIGLLILGSLLLFAMKPRSGPIAVFCCALPMLDAESHIVPHLELRAIAEAAPLTQLERAIGRGPGRGRAMVIGSTTLAYGMAGYYGIDLVNGYSGIMLGHYIDYFELMQRGAVMEGPRAPTVWNETRSLALPDLLQALDVTHIVTDRDLPLDGAGFEWVANFPDLPTYVFYRGVQSRTVKLWRAKQSIGPAYFAAELRPAPRDPKQLLEAIAQAPNARIAHVEGLGLPALGMLPRTALVHERRRGANRYEYAVETSSDAFLILSQVYYPGWEALLDGVPTALQRTNHAWMGCVIPTGKHRLELRMRSASLELGALLAALGALICAFWWVRVKANSTFDA